LSKKIIMKTAFESPKKQTDCFFSSYDLPSTEKIEQLRTGMFFIENGISHFTKESGIPLFPFYDIVDSGKASIGPHIHDFFEIELILEGEGVETIGGQDYPVARGNVFFINHIVQHRIRKAQTPLKRLMAAFAPSLIDGMFSTHSPLSVFTSHVLTEPFFSRPNKEKTNFILNEKALARVSVIWLQLIRSYFNGKPEYREFFIKNYFSSLLSALLEEYLDAGIDNNAGKTPLQPVINFINTNFQKTINIEMLVSLAGQSKSAVYKNFKKLTGHTLTGYINALKIEKSRELLLTTSLPLARIAEYLNFNSYTYFFRMFKKNCGISPEQYRTRRRELK